MGGKSREGMVQSIYHLTLVAGALDHEQSPVTGCFVHHLREQRAEWVVSGQDCEEIGRDQAATACLPESRSRGRAARTERTRRHVDPCRDPLPRLSLEERWGLKLAREKGERSKKRAGSTS